MTLAIAPTELSSAPVPAPQTPPSGGAAQAGFEAALSALGAPRPADNLSVGQKFEAATLTSFVDQLLPSEDEAIWGGSSGRMWRGLFAEHLAQEVARGGGVGIAEMIDRTLANRGAAPNEALPTTSSNADMTGAKP